jgi:Fe-S cluster assembly iron-binding protein IscA
MPITQNGVELTVAISEKAADKIKYFAEKDGITDNVGIQVAGKGFVFENPNAKKACGCGTSFSV